MSRKLGTRLILCLPVLGLLAGCALPLPVQIASWAVDGISFITTRKSLADHGLSLIARQDCAIWRGIVGGTVCITDDAGIIAVASTLPKTDIEADINNIAIDKNDIHRPSPSITSSSTLQPVSTDLVPSDSSDSNFGGIETFVTASGVDEPAFKERNSVQSNSEIPTIVVPPPPPPPTRSNNLQEVADRFYVIGQFARASAARSMAGLYARLGPEVIETRNGNRLVFKVMVGPFSPSHQNQVRGHILRSGINNIRIAHIDGSERFIARYYSIAAYTDKTPKTVSNIYTDTARSASFTRYKMALLHFFGV